MAEAIKVATAPLKDDQVNLFVEVAEVSTIAISSVVATSASASSVSALILESAMLVLSYCRVSSGVFGDGVVGGLTRHGLFKDNLVAILLKKEVPTLHK